MKTTKLFLLFVLLSAKLFSQDTIVKMDGSEVLAKVTEVGTQTITYASADPSNTNNYMMLKSDVFMVKYSNGTKEVYYNTAKQTIVDNTDYYAKGMDDGNTYYSGRGAMIGGFVCGLLPGWGTAGAVVIAVVTPDLNNPENPNNKLTQTNTDYYAGYKKQ